MQSLASLLMRLLITVSNVLLLITLSNVLAKEVHTEFSNIGTNSTQNSHCKANHTR